MITRCDRLDMGTLGSPTDGALKISPNTDGLRMRFWQ